MKKVFSLLLVAMFALSAWADVTVTFTPGETVGQNTAASKHDEMSLDGVKIECTQGAFLANPYRFAGGSTTTITSTVGNIKKIEFTCEGSYSQSYGPDQLYGNGYSCHSGSNVGTWQGDTAVVVLNAASQCRARKIVVTIAEDIVTELVEPVFHPAGGEFSGSLEVTLSCRTQNAQIYYWEGTAEEPGEWHYYSGPIYVTETKTLTAVSMKGSEMSDYVTVTFTKVDQTVEAPVFTPASCEFVDRLDVTLSCATANAKIYYSLDQELWSQYVDAIPVTDDLTIWAKAVVGDVESEVVSATYTRQVTTSEVIFDANVDVAEGVYSGHNRFTVVKYPVTMTVGDGMISNNGQYRFYGPSDTSNVVFTSVGAPIVKIEFSGQTGYTASHLSLAEGTGGTWTTGGLDGTWAGRANTVAFKVNKQARFVRIIVTVDSPDLTLLGDVDSNGEVNVTDVITLINYLSGTGVEINITNANCNKDAGVNVTDVIMLINYLSNGIWPGDE